MNIVDSSGWLEYFAAGPNADFFAPAIVETSQLIVPSISLYEVFKRVLQQRGEGDALQAIALMTQANLISPDTRIFLNAAKLSVEFDLPMAASIVLATARVHDAVLWTQDGALEGIARVNFISPSPF
jgi:predicted nucleic acid-binding protein